ncbi:MULTISPECIES: hypothetical protein [unclassified Streptomyces]|uniref:hypothetical protein n=1 Tax=unclassified Streptomyces TaxID=2593676 RepID=UPI00070C50D1|nr:MULTISPECIES: hypothetical protein [unclassified Streptomyces]KRD21152.1 hypothetical protein ASE41_14385 [Streptomyces sp. Root264]
MSTARRHPRSHTWLRVLVVLVALLAPAAPAGFAAPPAAASETVEYDVLDTPLRPASCPHRSTAPLRPAPLPPGDPATRPLSSSARASHPQHPQHPQHRLSALRTVILRC